MTTPSSSRLRALIDRLARLSEADDWAQGVTPTQHAALCYLARANRFSRSPSHVAAYLVATKGTTSQTLKTLVRKGLLAEHRSATDRRSISFDLTAAGQEALSQPNGLELVLEEMPATDQVALEQALADVLTRHLQTTGGRRFGLCAGCKYHQHGPNGTRHCALLGVALGAEEAEQICHEFTAA